MKRIVWKSASLLAGLALGCFDKGGPGPEPDYGVPEYGVWDSSYRDRDGDGWPSSEDCDDSDDLVFPGADEICDDGIDNDCDEAVDADDEDCGG